MTQEEKQLFLKDLCGRLPYGVKVNFRSNIEILHEIHIHKSVQTVVGESGILYDVDMPNVKPYLRPMSSMTKDEKKEYKSFFSVGEYSCGGSLYGEEYEYIADGPDDISQSICLFDWLNEHHFDYRGLIPMGLALEAPEGMYITE